MDVAQIWIQSVELVKDKVIHPTLWRSLEVAVPITLEDDQLVVGFGPGHMHMSSHLLSAEHKNSIESAIASIAGSRLRLVVIDGVSMSDWEHYKQRVRAAETARTKMREKTIRESETVHTWDGILEQVGRSFAAMSLRQLPQVRGRYIHAMIEIISNAMDELYNEEAPDEPSQRALARVIDRVATLTEAPSAIIAFELEKYRKAKKGG